MCCSDSWVFLCFITCLKSTLEVKVYVTVYACVPQSLALVQQVHVLASHALLRGVGCIFDGRDMELGKLRPALTLEL